MEHCIVGAYAAAGPSSDLPSFATRVAALDGVAGLELPYDGAGNPWLDAALLDALPGTHAVTMIPGVMGALAADPFTGLASTDAAGRDSAVRAAAEVAGIVRAANLRRPGAVAWVQVHTAPHLDRASPDALGRSLTTLLGLDWGGAHLVIEHCDTPATGHAPIKGFLPLADEIAVARAVGGVAITINWARSVLETHAVGTPSEHLELLTGAGLLGGLMFSGCAPVDTPFGAAWADSHVPPVLPGYAGLEHSLLTAERVTEALAHGATSTYVGLKIGAAPLDSDDARLALLARGVELIEHALPS